MINNQTTTSTTQSTFQFRRTSRHPSDETRAKISSTLKGYVKSREHCQHLSDSLKAYWKNDDNFPADTKSGEGNSGWLSDVTENNTGD